MPIDNTATKRICDSDVTLKEYVEANDEHLRVYLESRITAVEKSIETADAVLQARLALLNEFKDVLNTQIARTITREEMQSKIDAVCVKIEALEKFQATMEGKASQTQANINLLLAIIAIILGLVDYFLK